MPGLHQVCTHIMHILDTLCNVVKMIAAPAAAVISTLSDCVNHLSVLQFFINVFKLFMIQNLRPTAEEHL